MKRLCLTFSILLLTLPVTTAGESLPPEQEALARRLLNSQGCKACHRFEGGTTEVAGGLKELSQGLSRAELSRSLVNADHRHGKDLIPDFSHLQPGEIEALVNFLFNLPAASD